MKRSATRWLRISLIFLFYSCNESQELEDPCNSRIEISGVTISNSLAEESNGSIRVDASSGNGSPVFSIDGQNFQGSPIFNDLSAGTYIVYIKDELDCEAQVTAEINSILPVSYTKDIVPILETNCMVPSCHCDGNSLCFDNYELVSSYADEIRQRTSQRNMPPSYSGIFLSDQDIRIISDWVEQGAPNN